MEPMHSVWHYLEIQKQLTAFKRSSGDPLVDVPGDQGPNSVRSGLDLVGGRASGQIEMRAPQGSNSLSQLSSRDVLVRLSEEMHSALPDSRPTRRIKAELIEIALGFLLFAALIAFGLTCLLSPTFLT